MEELLYKLEKSRKDVETLLERHKRLIYLMLNQTGQRYNQDAESAAWEALWDAVCLFDVFCSTRFSTYACTLIKNAIYDTLRKQSKERMETELKEGTGCVLDEYALDQATALRHIENIFKNYVSGKNGLSKDILLAWYGASFDSTQREIAERCHCSISYVGKVQQDFRAHLSGKLKKS